MSGRDMRLPGRTAEVAWIKAFASHVVPGSPTGLPGERGGKWLLYPGSQSAGGQWWPVIRGATWACLLGHHSAASTLKTARYIEARHARGVSRLVFAPGPGRLPGPVIEVFTRDYRDKRDVQHVLGGLRDLGITGVVAYKTNAATRANMFGPDSVAYVSPEGCIIEPGPGPAFCIQQLERRAA